MRFLLSLILMFLICAISTAAPVTIVIGPAQPAITYNYVQPAPAIMYVQPPPVLRMEVVPPPPARVELQPAAQLLAVPVYSSPSRIRVGPGILPWRTRVVID